jgi:hypothetical protein
MVVLPAASRPTIKIRISFLPNWTFSGGTGVRWVWAELTMSHSTHPRRILPEDWKWLLHLCGSNRHGKRWGTSALPLHAATSGPSSKQYFPLTMRSQTREKVRPMITNGYSLLVVVFGLRRVCAWETKCMTKRAPRNRGCGCSYNSTWEPGTESVTLCLMAISNAAWPSTVCLFCPLSALTVFNHVYIYENNSKWPCSVESILILTVSEWLMT